MTHVIIPSKTVSAPEKIIDPFEPVIIPKQKPTKLAISEFPYAFRFREIVTEMADLYARKNADYGNSFAETIDKLGYAAALARIYDKWNRLCQLSQNGDQRAVKNESMLDTAIDGACYFIMLAMEIERANGLIPMKLVNSPYDDPEHT